MSGYKRPVIANGNAIILLGIQTTGALKQLPEKMKLNLLLMKMTVCKGGMSKHKCLAVDQP